MVTVIYVDPHTRELRHTSLQVSPPNINLVVDGASAHFVYIAGSKHYNVVCSDDRCYACFDEESSNLGTGTIFELMQIDENLIALKANNLFLCADLGGGLTLSRKECMAWETFELRRPRKSGPKIAAFTMVYNEQVFLPIWRRYYAQALGEENLFVLDHGSDDNSTADLGCVNRIRIPRGDAFDELQRAEFVSRFQGSLLCYYDVVIFSDADEFLVPDPLKYSGLADFAQRRCEQFVTAVGVEVLHLTDDEPDLNANLPILQQRQYVQFAGDYCKPLMSRVQLKWCAGFHHCQYQPIVDHDFFLFHLKRMDRNIAIEQLRRVQKIRWSDVSLRQQHGVQYRMDEGVFLSRMFPYTRETITTLATDSFDFSDDIRRWKERPNFVRGAVAGVPERFKDTICGAQPHESPHF